MPYENYPPCLHPAGHTSGTIEDYDAGCRCPETRSARRKYLHRHAAYGTRTVDNYTDATPIRKRLQSFVDQGVLLIRVEDATGLEDSSQRRILSGEYTKVRQSTADAVMGFTPTYLDKIPKGRKHVIGSARRLQALACLGWGTGKVKRMTGLHPQTIHRIRDQEYDTVKAEIADKIEYAYEQLWDSSPTPKGAGQKSAYTRVVSRAFEQGWVPPMAWDEGAIDNPDAEPATGWARPAKRLHGERLENLIELLDAGYSLTDELFTRAGYNSRESAVKALQRGGRSITEWMTDIGLEAPRAA